MLTHPPFHLHPTRFALLPALLLALAVCLCAVAPATAAQGTRAEAAAKKRAQVACQGYKRAHRRMRRAHRLFRARVARTRPQARRAKMVRAERGPRARRRARVRRLRRDCNRARRALRRVRIVPGSGPRGLDVTTGIGKGGVRWGLHANRWGRGPEGPGELERMRTMGVGWLREEFDSPPDAAADTLYREAATRGMRILPLLQTGNTLPDDVGAFARTVAGFSRRFGPGGDFWRAHPELDPSLASSHFEIYNEPYGDWFGPVQPARYAAVLRSVVPAGRAANPRARFLMAIDHTPGGERHTWIDDLYAAEPSLNQLFDGAAMHPYSGNRSPDKADDPWGFSRIAEARKVLAAHGAGDKPLWITEVGWSTCPGDPEWCVSEAQQAAYMERLAELVRTRYTFVDAVFYYHFVGEERDGSDPEDFFGILHPDFSPKPAFHALRRITGAG